MGKRIGWLCLCLFGLAGISLGQSQPKVSDIKAAPEKYIHNLVTIEGVITQYVDDPASHSTSFYILKDDYGAFIKVRTSMGKPMVNKRHRVTGPVTVDVQWNFNEPFIHEDSRVLLEETPQPRKGGTANYTIPLLVGGIGIIFISLVVVVALIITKSRSGAKDALLPGEMPVGNLPAPVETVEGKTIKMQLPPPGTLKLMPGRFEVTAGDDTVKEIRFYKPKGRTTAEVTFGRATGPIYSHIQLKPMTVSSRQAKVIFDGAAKAHLVNYASPDSNPTRINGREMGLEESVAIKAGDLIAMGEIEFRYHDN